MKKTLVLGASTNPSRYSNKAINRLTDLNHEVVALGRKQGIINGINILTGLPKIKNIHTITLYLNPTNQKEYYDYILDLHPQRIIFNPGTENGELMKLANDKGIAVEVGCTLVMLSIGNY